MTGYVCVGRGLEREYVYAVVCDCNTFAMDPYCAVMHAQCHGLCISVLSVCVEGGVYLSICLVQGISKWTR